MPEGDTIATYAARIAPLLVGATLREVDCRWPGVVDGLVGAVVRDVRAVGKNLLIDFDDGTLLRVHLAMKGTWHRYAPGEPWLRSRGGLAVMLATDAHVLVCFQAPTVERLDARAEPLHRALAALGPDLMQPDVDLDLVVQRALERGGPLARIDHQVEAQRPLCVR